MSSHSTAALIHRQDCENLSFLIGSGEAFSSTPTTYHLDFDLGGKFSPGFNDPQNSNEANAITGMVSSDENWKVYGFLYALSSQSPQDSATAEFTLTFIGGGDGGFE